MEKIEVPVHNHPLISFTSFAFKSCHGCHSYRDYIYGGYRCNELGCGVVFHKECAESLPEINHFSHPDHPLKLIIVDHNHVFCCGLCHSPFAVGYYCSICDFKLDLACAKRRAAPLVILEKFNAHEHPLKILHKSDFFGFNSCKLCDVTLRGWTLYYSCHQCDLVFHADCVEFFTESYHTSHPQHPLKFFAEAPDYADKECLLCGIRFDHGRLHHCDVCNFSICSVCMKNPPPLVVVSPTSHEHQLHVVPRRINYTCNACGTQGDRSPYFCLQSNFMIHRDCIDLPRVININRHDHRISYTSRLGHGEWKCKVCRKKVDGFYGAYSCSKCPTFVVHSRCATRTDVWDMIELEGTPAEPEEVAPFEVIDANTIKHFSHDHNLRTKKDGRSLHESILCEACVFQICSESFYYSCDKCNFTLHEKCANLRRKTRHVCHNQRFKLQTDSLHEAIKCILCNRAFTGFRYRSDSDMILDIHCGSISEPFVHKSHPHPLYYSTDNSISCSGCGWARHFSCDECDFSLCSRCAILPQEVMRHRYDDHPLFLSYGESNVDGEYWCEACETKVNPEKWFYTCNDCGVTLHISCLVGDLSYKMPGSVLSWGEEVVTNTSICRILCCVCNLRCKLPFILKVSKDRLVLYMCSFKCRYKAKL